MSFCEAPPRHFIRKRLMMNSLRYLKRNRSPISLCDTRRMVLTVDCLLRSPIGEQYIALYRLLPIALGTRWLQLSRTYIHCAQPITILNKQPFMSELFTGWIDGGWRLQDELLTGNCKHTEDHKFQLSWIAKLLINCLVCTSSWLEPFSNSNFE